MQSAGELMRRRSAIVEHPFGTLKCRAGYRHFLLRGFNKVRGEWSLMALCYNLTRVLNIIGLPCVPRQTCRRTRLFAASAYERCHQPCQDAAGGILRANCSTTSSRSALLHITNVNSHTCPVSTLNPSYALIRPRRCCSEQERMIEADAQD